MSGPPPGGRGRGAGRGGGTAAPPGGGVRATTSLQQRPLDAGDRLSTYGLDLENLRFDLSDRGLKRNSKRADEAQSVSDLWQSRSRAVATQPAVDGASMFGDFQINVDSSAKAGTELGFEFKAILDNDYGGFTADDFDVEINASSIALSGVSVCEACKQSILKPNDGVALFGRAYHRNHIKCSVTGKDFSDGSNALEGDDGQVYCEAEWEKRFLKKCHKCSKGIREKKPPMAGGHHYHKACFVCTMCSEPLIGRVFEDDGKIICENDFHRKRGTVCPACTKPVEGESTKVGKYVFHPTCYKCHYCRRPPANFFKQIPHKSGVIYCSVCAGRIYPEQSKSPRKG